MRRIVFGVIICAQLAPISVVAQDYVMGLKAARSGDYPAALEEWRPLATKGHAQAQHELGLMYGHGRGVKQDYTQAANWYRKAAEQGVAASQLALGRLFVAGRGIEKEFPKALSWFRKAAAQGSAAAKNNLAYMYRYGKGTPPDIGKAIIFYVDAGSKGYAPALDNLGMLFANGQSVPKDYVEAYKWLTLATSFGSSRGARYLKYVTKKMNSAQVAKAKVLVREWIADFRKRKKK